MVLCQHRQVQASSIRYGCCCCCCCCTVSAPRAGAVINRSCCCCCSHAPPTMQVQAALHANQSSDKVSWPWTFCRHDKSLLSYDYADLQTSMLPLYDGLLARKSESAGVKCTN